ncbi:GNAT family N-acetyltransferase [Arenibaculum pallidiluteum]|uniref:GNAT family N-acetyltransferase n=1 Tax=Arenibaculum pallidiluteum TaxID=2812559 RepID=UPI001A974E8F|nr:GNAT family N-acetyltransferase [Arenibaculum pallidiluteum]
MEVMRVSIEPLGDPAALEAAWRDLEARATPSFFTSWTWVGCWLAETGAAPWIVRVRAQGRIVGLGLIAGARRMRHGWLRSNALLLQETGDPGIDEIYAEYNGLLAETGREAEVLAAFLDHLTAGRDLPPGVGGWDELRLGGVGQACLDAAARTGLPVRLEDVQPSAAVDLEAVRAAGGDYLAGLSANTRQQLRRACRLYEARGPLAVEVARDLPEALDFLDALAELHQRTWEARGRAGAFASPFFGRFHRALIARGLPRGEVELLRIRAGGTTLGYLYDFARGGWVGNYASGFAYEEDPKLKPGLVCFRMTIEHHLARGASSFDFMAGGQRYKTSLGSPGPTLYWIDLRRPRLKFRVEGALRRLRDLVRPRPGQHPDPAAAAAEA